LWHIHASHLDD